MRNAPARKFSVLTDEQWANIPADVKEFCKFERDKEYAEDKVQKILTGDYSFHVETYVADPERFGFGHSVTVFKHISLSGCQAFIYDEKVKEMEYNELCFEEQDKKLYGELIGKKQVRGCRYTDYRLNFHVHWEAEACG